MSSRSRVFALLVAIAWGAWAAPASAEDPAHEGVTTLREGQLFERWLRSSAEVAAWRAEVGNARFDVITAKLLPNPELSVTGLFRVAGASPDGETGVQGQLTVPLPIFGQLEARRSAAEALVSVAEARLLDTLWDRAADLQGAMVDAAFADARVEMHQQNLVELGRLRQIVETRTLAGANSTYDVLRVATAETTVRAALSTALTERTQAESRLAALVAAPTLTSVRVTRKGLGGFRGPEDERALVRIALERRPDLELARRTVVASSRAADRYRKDAIPTPSAVAGLYLVDREYGVQASAGVSVPLPIFDRNQGQVGRALSEAQSSELLAKALETRIASEVAGAWRAREAARTALREYREAALPANVELLRRAEVTYQAGKFSIVELFDAYRTMWDARSQELELERQMAVAEASVERAAVLVPIAPPRSP